ncbi:MAG: acetamidase/formamidase family protein [Thermomicrobiales bacterium]|jgi:acetamidase/formamidase|nr:acetamidase/formamidase family protein [Thermomicrobiales bacterium]
MKRIALEQFGYDLRKPADPVLIVDSGETFVVETEDTRSGAVRTQEQATAEGLKEFRRNRDAGKFGSPLTGPIFVNGAEPGDVLAVSIHQIIPDSTGFTGTWPFLQPDWFTEPVTKFVDIRDGWVHYNDKIRFPVRPMIGCLGCTPPPESGKFSEPGPWGGNMDCPEVKPGNTLLFPVGVPGAGFYIGDAHAAQADGEFCGGGIEIRAETTLTLTVRKNKPERMTWPRIETPDAIGVIACSTHLEDALDLAVRDLCYWLCDDFGYDNLTDAFFVATQVADGRACQVLPNTPGPHVIRVMMPRDYLFAGRTASF